MASLPFFYKGCFGNKSPTKFNMPINNENIDGTLTVTTTPSQIRPFSYGNKKVTQNFLEFQNWSLNPGRSLVSYLASPFWGLNLAGFTASLFKTSPIRHDSPRGKALDLSLFPSMLWIDCFLALVAQHI